MKALRETHFKLPGQEHFYRGKVRDVYTLTDDLLIMVASDRLSAFDVVLPKGIPYKGQVLNQIATKFLDLTEDIVPNWKLASPDPQVTVGIKAEPFKVEMVIRGFLTGHAWRVYSSGKRELCGIKLPEGMRENEAFPEPIITPTTKADQGAHDEDISREAILEQGIVSEADYIQLESYTRQLFARGQEFALKQGLLLVDTKYEFGKTKNGDIILIDEIHTPDSSRYFYAEGYHENLEHGLPQKQLSKEFVRQWLIEHNFQGKDGDELPEMNDTLIEEISQRYIELYEHITGLDFERGHGESVETRIENNILNYLNT
jgi:phosphoribosylaminoimidazole-succinocarboxamide synthase